MSFIASYFERFRDPKILVWEKVDGRRKLKRYTPPYYFYTPSDGGEYTAITGEALKRIDCRNKTEFEEVVMQYSKRFESDLNPQEKCMMDNYVGKPLPILTVGLVDIEVDYSPKIGWARPDNPYAPINALTLYRSDLKAYTTIAVAPPGCTPELRESLGAKGYLIVDSERELLEIFLEILDDVDVISGWNSEFFDLPYLGKRLEMNFGLSGFKKLGFEEGPVPRWSEAERFKGSNPEIILDLMSRVHLDYMALFKKFNLEGRQSYSLAAIADDELEIPKLHYDGSLHDLYHDDFEHFCDYNKRDVEILVKLDEKFKYIELANAMVHEATVNFDAIFGSVQLIDTAVINYCHTVLKKIIFDKTHKPKTQVEGALVLSPKIGFYEWVGSIDIKSLYPSVYRTLNLSPEKIVGQLLEYEDGWKLIHKLVKNPDDGLAQIQKVNFQIEGSEEVISFTAENFITFLRENKYAISAYGTILDQSSGEGLIPSVLSHWFMGRLEMQATKKKHGKLADKMLSDGIDQTDPTYLEHRNLESYYDMLQGVRKILLNSLYGSNLSEFCRFHDPRLGASTTGSGRQITTHMLNTVSALLIGENSPNVVKVSSDIAPRSTSSSAKGGRSVMLDSGKQNEYSINIPEGLGPVYADTDSTYFTMSKIVDNVEDGIACADSVAGAVNESFPPFIREAFLCQPGFDTLISANREMVARSGIFRAKKKYVMYVADMEGKRIDPDSPKALKTQGSDIKISSTPMKIREMLKSVTMSILRKEDRKKIINYIIDFRKKLSNNDASEINLLEFASVSSVSTYDKYYEQWERIEKTGLGRAKINSAAVRAAINHNHYLELIGNTESPKIMGGDKVKMLWLSTNDHGFTNMAFPSETEELPKWFTDKFEVDLKVTEQKLVDQKLKNLFEPINWEVPSIQTEKMHSLVSFE